MSRILKISGKCSDMFGASFEGKHHDGYVPRSLGVGAGDYINLSIDIDTGQIVGWKTPTQEQLDGVFNKDDEQE